MLPAYITKRKYYVLFLLVFFINGCIKHNPPSWDTFVSEFVEGYFKLNPDKAVLAGRHEYDGLLADYSEKGMKEQIDWLKKQREQVIDFIDPILSETQKIEKKNLVRIIDENIFWLETMKWPYVNAGYYYSLLSPSIYTSRNYAPLEERLKAYTRYLVSMKTAVPQIQENFAQNLPLPAIYIDVAKNIFLGYVNQMRNEAPVIYKSINNEKLQQDLRSATEEAVTTILNFVSWLDIQRPKATDKISIGKNNFLRMIYVSDFVNVQLPELKALIEKDLQDNTASLKKACKAYAPNKSIEDCIKLINDKKTKGDIISFTADELQNIENFIRKKSIVTIPKYSSVSVHPSPAYMHWLNAYPDLAAPFEKKNEGKLYLAVPDTSNQNSENAAAVPTESEIVLHALECIWPGEFLHSLYYSHSRSLIARVFYNSTTVKGWAGYAQGLMLDQGYRENSRELEISYLLKSILYDVGFLASIKIHTEEMPLAEAENMFINMAFSNQDAAKQYSLFAAGDPQYFSGAFGKILITNLRDEWLAIKQPKYSLKNFHDRFLSNGMLPIPMIRENLLRR